MTVSGELKKKLECLEQDVPIICPPVNVQFSCHVCLQVSDTSYLIAMSDEFFKGRVSPNFGVKGQWPYLRFAGV